MSSNLPAPGWELDPPDPVNRNLLYAPTEFGFFIRSTTERGRASSPRCRSGASTRCSCIRATTISSWPRTRAASGSWTTSRRCSSGGPALPGRRRPVQTARCRDLEGRSPNVTETPGNKLWRPIRSPRNRDCVLTQDGGGRREDHDHRPGGRHDDVHVRGRRQAGLTRFQWALSLTSNAAAAAGGGRRGAGGGGGGAARQEAAAPPLRQA